MKQIYRSEQGRQVILNGYEAILQYWPQPNKQFTVPTRFSDTFIVRSGKTDGPPVILLHGSTTNSAMWMGDAPVLGQTHCVYAVDIIGEPGKSAESRPPAKEGSYAQWLSDVLDGLNLSSCAIVANSLGGWMALDFATTHPERVDALALLATGGLSPVQPAFVLKAIRYRLGGKSGAAKLNKLLFGNIELPDAVLEYAELLRKHYSPRPFEARVFTDEEIKRLSMPVLFFGGDGDAIFDSKQSAARLSQLAPRAQAHVLKDTPHTLINLAVPIAAFLNEKGAHDD